MTHNNDATKPGFCERSIKIDNSKKIKKEEVSKVKRRLWESPKWKLSPSGTRIKRGCIGLLIQPLLL